MSFVSFQGDLPKIPSYLDSEPNQKVVKAATLHLSKLYQSINQREMRKRFDQAFDNYGEKKVLGSGIYGTALKLSDGNVMKLQIPPSNEKFGPIYSRVAEKEYAILRDLQGHSAIPLLKGGIAERGVRYAMVMNDAGPNLFDLYLNPANQERKSISLSEIAQTGKTLLKGIEWMHGKGIAHLDLKPENLTETYILDFGAAEKVSEITSRRLRVSSFYRPPEVVLGYPHGTAVDMWSLGCILFELYHKSPLIPVCDAEDRSKQNQVDVNLMHAFLRRLGAAAYPEILKKTPRFSDFFEKVEGLWQMKTHTDTRAASLLPFREAIAAPEELMQKEFIDLLSKLLQFDPNVRLTAEDALKHPFFNLGEGYDCS